jgi:hypothetical protein
MERATLRRSQTVDAQRPVTPTSWPITISVRRSPFVDFRPEHAYLRPKLHGDCYANLVASISTALR